MAPHKKRPSTDNLINLVLLAVLAYAAFMPGSVARKSLADWWGGRALTKALQVNWEELAATKARVGALDGESLLMVKFSDYQCRYCKMAHSEIETLVKAPEAAVGIRHFPVVAIHPYATKAAIASICGEFQDRFSEMHAELFRVDDWQQEPDWVALGIAAGLEVEHFRACLRSERAQQRLEDDLALAAELGVTGTPTFVTRGRLHAGYLNEDDLRQLIGTSW